MAVELRCPDCRAKLKLGEAPDAGTEVECPKCGTVFPAPEPEPADEDAAPKKKKRAKEEAETDADAGDEGDKPKKEKKEKKEKKAKAGADPKAPRRRKAKKKETSKAAMIAVIGLGLFMLLVVGGALFYLLGRTSKSVEMMYYLPEDTDTVTGLNLGHAQKYPEFYKNLSGTFQNTEFKPAGDALAKAVGVTDIDALIDYIVFGNNSKGHSAVVIRTKTEIDPGALSKLPGAQPKDMGGKKYFVVEPFKGSVKVRVFAPTNRLIVYCPPDVPDAVFGKMLNGHADSKDKTVGVRAGPLGKRVTRGTFWGMTLYESANKPPAAPAPGGAGGNDDAKVQFAQTVSSALNNSKGMGIKASIGSREVRFEVVVWYPEGERSAEFAKKMKESDLGKGDEAEPPRWWKDQTGQLGSKKISAQLLANIGFGSSGDLFYAKSAVDTVDLKDAISAFASKVNPQQQQQAGMMPPGMMPPGGMRPPGMRRRVWARR